jgi:hypothetical protein
MTDREMLELAAKAAGISVWFPRMADGKGGVVTPCHTETIGEGTVQWNPRLDDAQALRLAVKLHINIEHLRTLRGNRFDEISAYPSGRGDCLAVIQTSTDPYAATRLAIVSAAAEIGKSMETQDD